MALSSLRGDRLIGCLLGGLFAASFGDFTLQAQGPTPVARSSRTSNVAGSVAEIPPRFQLNRSSLELASQLSVSSLDSFRRGLMPTHDYLERIGYIHALRSQEAKESGDARQLRGAMQARVAELQVAFSIAEGLRQPNAEGWIADNYLLRASLAESQQQLAILQGDRGQAQAAAQDQRAATEGYLKQVLFDYDLGIGSLPTVEHAVFLTARQLDGDKPGPFTDRAREFQKLTLIRMDEWSRQGADIGRTDRLQEALIGQDQTAAQVALVSKNSPDAMAMLRRADQTANDLFQKRLEYLGRGTESLAGLTHAWMIRERVQRLAIEAEYVPSSEMTDQLRQGLSELKKAADGVRDLRGRNLADVQFVRLISETSTAGTGTP